MKAICPECQAGKHRNCDGTAWDHAQDQITLCGCEQAECRP